MTQNKSGIFRPCSQKQPLPETLQECQGIFSLYVFSWSIVALQCCIGFCWTTTCIRHKDTSPPSLLSLPPTPHPTHQVITEHWAERPVLYNFFPLASYFTHDGVYTSTLLPQFIPPTPSPVLSTSPSLCLRLDSCPANTFVSTTFLDPIYVH